MLKKILYGTCINHNSQLFTTYSITNAEFYKIIICCHWSMLLLELPWVSQVLSYLWKRLACHQMYGTISKIWYSADRMTHCRGKANQKWTGCEYNSHEEWTRWWHQVLKSDLLRRPMAINWHPTWTVTASTCGKHWTPVARILMPFVYFKFHDEQLLASDKVLSISKPRIENLLTNCNTTETQVVQELRARELLGKGQTASRPPRSCSRDGSWKAHPD